MPLFSAHLCVLFTTFTSFDCCILVPLLSLAAKGACLLHLGSDDWYLNKIKEEYHDPSKKGYAREGIEEYLCKVLRGYAEADCEFLGQHLPGAPDEIQPGTEVEPGYIFITSLIGWTSSQEKQVPVHSSCTIGSRTASIGIPKSISTVPIGCTS